MMTIFDLLKSSTYTQKPILEKLVCHATGRSKTELFLHTDDLLTEQQLTWIQNAYHRYVFDKEPVEYILGYVEFAKLQVVVSPATIIPRPETEYMLEAVREYFDDTTSAQPVTLIDVGTGSGILGLCTVYYQSAHIAQAFLTELSTDALAIAQQNKEKLLSPDQQAKTTLLHCSLLNHPDLEKLFQTKETHVLLVANLPYIPDEMFANNADERITTREPTVAFVGGADGLDLYRKMFDQLISAQVQHLTMYLEMMTRQIDLLAKEYVDYFLFDEVKTFHANIRILKGVRKQ